MELLRVIQGLNAVNDQLIDGPQLMHFKASLQRDPQLSDRLQSKLRKQC